jgi:predicted N-acetyltransferase YhbS
VRKSEIKPTRGISHNGMGLGPMAVRPSLQRQGIGSRLVEEGLARMRSGGEIRFLIGYGPIKSAVHATNMSFCGTPMNLSELQRELGPS